MTYGNKPRVADPNLSRQLASSVIEALKHAGHVLIAKGKSETLLRELASQIEPTLVKVIPRILRSEITGEVTSTFGDEATDEAVEELVERLREQMIDSEGIEDIFADDKVIDRVIFRTLHEGLVHSAHAAREDEEDDAPPISVRLDTLGYVASTASKLTDSETLKDALERAALSASTELDTFDAASRTAFFASSDDDPDKRLEIEEAVEEELADLVEMGLVDLPTSVRSVPLPHALDEARRKALKKPLHEMAARVLASRVCPGTWDWDGATAIKLTFTPMSEPDAKAVDGAVAQFTRELAMLLEGDGRGDASFVDAIASALEAQRKAAPPSTRGATAKKVAPAKRAIATSGTGSKTAATAATSSKKKESAADEPAAKKEAATKKDAAVKKSAAPRSAAVKKDAPAKGAAKKDAPSKKVVTKVAKKSKG